MDRVHIFLQMEGIKIIIKNFLVDMKAILKIIWCLVTEYYIIKIIKLPIKVIGKMICILFYNFNKVSW